MVLAPQLRQSLKILQVPAQELRSTILEELQTNPLLEELPIESISIETTSPQSPDSNGETVSSDGSESGSDELRFKEDFEVFAKLDEDWRDYFSQASGQQVFTSEDAERRQHFFDSLVSETSLQEHLMRQAELSEAGPEEMEAMPYLIG
ncbi:MAG TPA: RNA polymerase sigma-54 factor, partial [Opitutales bacterium]|nr:RNA polymerase sigma-54 factor [Opitutales bacterium]